jgi:phosphate-selective porin OprO/OprP
VEAGKFKQPFSYEQLIQDRFVPTMERSLIDQLTPARDFGLMVHGQKLLDGRLDYAVAVSNGDVNSDTDLNDHKDIAGRLVVYPFGGPEGPWWLKHLQVGISGTYGHENELVSPTTLRTPATVPWFQFNPTVRAEGHRSRWSPELAYFAGPFGFAAQYLREEQELRPSTTGAGSRHLVEVPYEGFYVLASCLLTGEERTGYSQPIEPLAPFDPKAPGWACGAWELIGRYSRLRVGDVVFASGAANLANASLYSPEASEVTVGANWYLNRWVRLQFNWEHAMFDKPVQLGNGGQKSHREMDTLLARVQIIF